MKIDARLVKQSVGMIVGGVIFAWSAMDKGRIDGAWNKIHETGGWNYKRDLFDRTSGDHCTGIDVYYGLCNESDLKI